jgi:4-hydroxy-3-polyprenylbenzoate decarboxylase
MDVPAFPFPPPQPVQPPAETAGQATTVTPPFVVGITGASGSVLGFRLIAALLHLGRSVELVMTEKSLQVIFEERQLKVAGNDETAKSRLILDHLGLAHVATQQLRVFGNHRLDAPPSSGTHLTSGMAVIPCSMGTLGRIANGITDNLVARSADVTLKENRRLVLVPRESPLNGIHLGNMLKLSQCGVIILPPVLTFYLPSFAASVEGQIDYTVGKTLDHFGLTHNLYQRWG